MYSNNCEDYDELTILRYDGSPYTKYSYMTNDEFITHIQDKLGNSPIIDELIARLETCRNQVIYKKQISPKNDSQISCPCCESLITILCDEKSNGLSAIG